MLSLDSCRECLEEIRDNSFLTVLYCHSVASVDDVKPCQFLQNCGLIGVDLLDRYRSSIVAVRVNELDCRDVCRDENRGKVPKISSLG